MDLEKEIEGWTRHGRPRPLPPVWDREYGPRSPWWARLIGGLFDFCFLEIHRERRLLYWNVLKQVKKELFRPLTVKRCKRIWRDCRWEFKLWRWSLVQRFIWSLPEPVMAWMYRRGWLG